MALVLLIFVVVFFLSVHVVYPSKDGHKDWIFSIAWINDTMAVSGKLLSFGLAKTNVNDGVIESNHCQVTLILLIS